MALDDKLSKLSMEDTAKSVQNLSPVECLLERVFLFTVKPDGAKDPKRPPMAVSLREFHECTVTSLALDPSLGEALFARIRMPNTADAVVSIPGSTDHDGTLAETKILLYLYQSYCRAAREAYTSESELPGAVAYCKRVIVDNLATIIASGNELLEKPQKILGQLQHILATQYFDGGDTSRKEALVAMLTSVALELESSDNLNPLYNMVLTILDCLATVLRGYMGRTDHRVLSNDNMALLYFFASNKTVAEMFISYSTPAVVTPGQAVTGFHFERTVLGMLLSCSVLPNPFYDNASLFNDAGSLNAHLLSERERQFWMFSSKLAEFLSDLLLKMIRLSDRMRHVILTWIGRFLYANRGRTTLASLHSRNIYSNKDCTDGCMLNMSAVLLQMSKPFAKPNNPKLMKIDQSYTQYEFESGSMRSQNNGHHLQGLSKVTFLSQVDSPGEGPSASSDSASGAGAGASGGQDSQPTALKVPALPFGFVTELYFMTAYSLHLGFHAVFERMTMMSNELGRMQSRLGPDGSGSALPPQLADLLKKKLKEAIPTFLCMKCGLTEEPFYDMLLDFQSASACYLVRLAEQTGDNSSAGQGPANPLTQVPEFVLTTMIDSMLLVHRFRGAYAEKLAEKSRHFLDVVVCFMGERTVVRSPHMRANLAAALEGMLPSENHAQELANFHKKSLFTDHPKAFRLSEALASVFVSIEMTGEGVQFEEKFQCRRPMYRILAYLVEIPMHQKEIKKLATYSEDHVTDVKVPLFLQFVHLLINDAIFLLDEAFSHMQSIKESEEARQRGEWARLTHAEAQEKETGLRQAVAIARSANILARDTTSTLRLLTRLTQSIFCHSAMVERMAAMLNYLLLHLTSKSKMGALKVHNMEEVNFQPKVLVADICQIYLHLRDSKSFQEAVGQEGRSYSEDLFVEAAGVLNRIGSPLEDIQQFMKFANQVKEVAKQQEEEESFLSDPPAQYLDPIMSTLMTDPVLLTTSGVVLDRVTISRHLLSDQTDPFNRERLTLDMVKDQPALKAEIAEWVQKAKTAKRSQ